MTDPILFPFAEYYEFYIGFTIFVLMLLALDLGVFHRKAHAVSVREALGWSIAWVFLALVFSVLLRYYAEWSFAQDPRLQVIPGFDAAAEAKQATLEYLTGYIIEKSLSVDNLFIFAVVFSYFGIPAIYQHRVLFFGILGALIFRILFIIAGAALLRYHLILVIFGVFLVFTGLRVMFSPEKPLEPEKNPVVRLLRRFLPVTPTLEGQRFLLKRDGRIFATPLLVVLAFIEVTDIVFAVDSVPAIFAITREPLIVYTSNVFAILGLRSLYFLLAGVIGKFHLLKYGLGAILVFVGLKMAWLNDFFGGKFPIRWSLGIILSLLLVTIIASLLFPRRESDANESHV